MSVVNTVGVSGSEVLMKSGSLEMGKNSVSALEGQKVVVGEQELVILGSGSAIIKGLVGKRVEVRRGEEKAY